MTPINTGADLRRSAHDPDHRHRRTPSDPQQVESPLIKPILAGSVALNPLCSRVLRPTAPSVRMPAVTADATAAWVAEGAEIPISDLTAAEVDAVTRQVAGLSVVTSELAEDSSPEATAEVGRGLARDIALSAAQPGRWGRLPTHTSV
jgi:HK97 family phage major capsid protein